MFDFLYSHFHLYYHYKLCTGHAATVLGEYMYVMGGNDLSETFGDLWRISLESIKNYVEKQWEMENKIEMNIETSNSRDSIEAEGGDRNNIGGAGAGAGAGGVGRISRRGSGEAGSVVHFKYPVWELLCKNCSAEGTYHM